MSQNKKSKIKQISKRTAILFLKFAFKTILVIFFIVLIVFNIAYHSLGDLKHYAFEYPELTGLNNKTRNYLIILQNNYELRATGGFITAYGLISFNNGKLSNFDIEDIYTLNKPSQSIVPPYPMKKFLQGNMAKFPLFFRDANYSANFKDSAMRLIDIFHENKPSTRIDGVFAVNFSFIEGLVNTLDGIKINNKKYTKSNIFSEIENSVNNVDKHNIDELNGRKSFLPSLLDSLVEKTIASPKKFFSIRDFIISSLNNKDIQLYFLNETLNKITHEKQWDGSWENDTSDTLGIVEHNLGGLKSNRYISKTVNYNIEILDNNDAFANLDINIKHNGLLNIPISGDYKGFIEIYTPKGSKIVSNNNDSTNFSSKTVNGYTVFSEELFIKPGESQNISYRYKLPSSAFKDQKYSLFVPKQSGTNDFYDIKISAPRKYYSNSNKFIATEHLASYAGILKNNFKGSIEFTSDSYPPYPIWQEFSNLNTIKVTFNEAIKKEEATNIKNYVITDSNTANDTTDVIKINSIDLINNTLIFDLNGITNQPEEHYKITFKDIEDIYGNKTNPELYTITVVQRI